MMITRSSKAAAAAVALAALIVSAAMAATAWAQDASAPPSACPSLVTTTSPDPFAPTMSSPMPDGNDGCQTDTIGGPPVVTVDAGDLWFAPNTITLPSDEPTRLVLVGVGQVAHNLIIDELGLQLAVGPGTSSEVVVSDLPPGTYQFYCAIFGHRRAGMFGTLTVEATIPG